MKLETPIPVVSALRLPQGRFGGSFKGQGAVRLGADLVASVLARHPKHTPQKVWWGMARSHTQGMNPARTIGHLAGLPNSALGTTVNMACGSGLQAVFSAALDIGAGAFDYVLAGGSESMSDTPFLLPDFRWGYQIGHRELPDVMYRDGLQCPIVDLLMGQTIELLAAKHGISRSDADIYALESHRRASRADFSSEIVAHCLLGRDECIRFDADISDFSALKPVYEEDGHVTAGNASAIADGAACVLLAHPENVKSGCIARILGWSEVALDPIDMGFGPVPAVRLLLEQHGLGIGDIALWELNEAFASQVICCARALNLPMERLNVAGGGISLGHPIGASGARILVTLIHLLRNRGGGLGVATLGVGGGIGQAVLLEA
jgi:acetyl-CoA C-acetyltransferase